MTLGSPVIQTVDKVPGIRRGFLFHKKRSAGTVFP